MQNTNTDLLSNALTLSFKNAALEGEYLAEVAKRRWPVLLFIFCFDILCYFFRITAKCVQLMLEAEPASFLRRGCDLAREFGPQLANMAVLYLFLGLLNRRSRRLGDKAARQEEVLLSMCMAFAICNLLASLTSENSQDYVYVAFFLICTSTFLKIRWWVGTAIQAVPAALMQYLVLLGTTNNGLFGLGFGASVAAGCHAAGLGVGATSQQQAGMPCNPGRGGAAAASASHGDFAGGGGAAPNSVTSLAALLPPHAAVHVAVAWAVGGLMAYLADWYRRQMFAHSKLAALAHGSELMEAQARIAAQRALAAAQAQAAQRALSVAREKAANEAKSEFMSLMCHEVRTPLNGCLASAEMLLETPLLAEQRELAATIRVSGSILLSTVSNFLDFFKLEAGKALDIVRTCTDLRQLVADVHCIIEAMIGRGGEVVLLDPDMQGLLSHMVYCDADRVRGILLNLYTNAAKFTKHGHIQLRVREVPPGYAPGPAADYGAIVVSPPSYNHINGTQQSSSGHLAYPTSHAGSRPGRLASQLPKGASASAAGHAAVTPPALVPGSTHQPSVPGAPHRASCMDDASATGWSSLLKTPAAHLQTACAPLKSGVSQLAADHASSSPFQQHQQGKLCGISCDGGDVCSWAVRNTSKQDGGDVAGCRPEHSGNLQGAGHGGGSVGDTDEVYYSGEASLVSPVKQPILDRALTAPDCHTATHGAFPRDGLHSDSKRDPAAPASWPNQANNADHHDLADIFHATVAPTTRPATGTGDDAAEARDCSYPPRMQNAMAEGTPRWLLFEVADTGTGITPDGLKTLFREYVQGTEDEMRKPRSKGGTGLGLSICSKQVGLLGGRIGAYSCPGRGSIFWFTIPLIEVSSRSHGTEMQEQQQQVLPLQSNRNCPEFSPFSEFTSTAPARLSGQCAHIHMFPNLGPILGHEHGLAEAEPSDHSKGLQPGAWNSGGESKPSARLIPFLDGAKSGPALAAVWPHASSAQQQHQTEGMLLVGESSGGNDGGGISACGSLPTGAPTASGMGPCSLRPPSDAAAGGYCVSGKAADGIDSGGATVPTPLAGRTASGSSCFLSLMELSSSYCRPAPAVIQRIAASAAAQKGMSNGGISGRTSGEERSSAAGSRHMDGATQSVTSKHGSNQHLVQPLGGFVCEDVRQPAPDMISAAAASPSALSSMDGRSSSHNRGLVSMFVPSTSGLRNGSTSYGSIESVSYRSPFCLNRPHDNNVAAMGDKDSSVFDGISTVDDGSNGLLGGSNRRGLHLWGPSMMVGAGSEEARNSSTSGTCSASVGIVASPAAELSPNGAELNGVHAGQRLQGSAGMATVSMKVTAGMYGLSLQKEQTAGGQPPAVLTSSRGASGIGLRTGGRTDSASNSAHFRALSGRRVLLVEDNLINQTVARKMLASLGLQCEVASNGLEAVKRITDAMAAVAAAAAAASEPCDSNCEGCHLAASSPGTACPKSSSDCPTAPSCARRSSTSASLLPAFLGSGAGPPAQARTPNLMFDVVLMDMAMPVMGGVDATRSIRRLGCAVPIVAMTANALDRDREECRRAGMNGFLSKPVLKEMLAESLVRVLEGSGWAQQGEMWTIPRMAH